MRALTYRRPAVQPPPRPPHQRNRRPAIESAPVCAAGSTRIAPQPEREALLRNQSALPVRVRPRTAHRPPDDPLPGELDRLPRHDRCGQGLPFGAGEPHPQRLQ